MPAPPARTIRSIVAMVPLLLVAVACASDPPALPPAASAVTDPPTTTTTGPATTTTAAPKTVEERVAAAYVAAEEAFFEALKEPADPAVDLADHWSGSALDHVRDVVAAARDKGVHATFVRGEPQVMVMRLDVTGSSSAFVRSCVIDPIVMADDAGVAVDSDVSSRQYASTLVRGEDGRWRVTSGTREMQWDDGRGCVR